MATPGAGSPVPLQALAALRLDALVINLELLGTEGWGYLDQLSTDVPNLGVLVLRPLERNR